MQENHKDFWSRLQESVDVVVASRDTEQLLGVRDGFRRYFQRRPGLGPAIAVRSGIAQEEAGGILTSVDAMLTAAVERAERLRAQGTSDALFFVGTEEGLSTFEIGGVGHQFLQCWTVVSTPLGSACGGSGPVEIPEHFTRSLEMRGPVRIPGTRRSGGILGSLTAGLELRREAFSLATFHAVSSLLFGLGQSGHGAFWRSD